jgi:hypothetical protein
MTDRDETLMAAVAAIDVVDLAGAIIHRPRHAMVSTAGQLALALAFEKAWAICLEAEVLARALAEPREDALGLRALTIEMQTGRVLALMKDIKGQERTDGRDD